MLFIIMCLQISITFNTKSLFNYKFSFDSLFLRLKFFCLLLISLFDFILHFIKHVGVSVSLEIPIKIHDTGRQRVLNFLKLQFRVVLFNHRLSLLVHCCSSTLLGKPRVSGLLLHYFDGSLPLKDSNV